MATIEKIYVPHFGKYGNAELSVVIVAKETPKTFVVDSHEPVIEGSWYIDRRVLKTGVWFETEREATEWLADKAREYAQGCNVRYKKAKATAEWLQRRAETV